MSSVISETLPKFTAEALKLAAKQSERCHIVPVRLRRAIKKYLREQEATHMRRKVLSLSQSFNGIKEVNLLLPSSTSKELVEDPLKAMERSQRWKVKTAYGDVGLTYQEDQTVAYVAARMPAVYSALYRVLSEVKRRVPDFTPAKVLDFGAGTGSALWAMMEVWPGSLERINLVEPSQSMQRAGQSLVKDFRKLPLIQSYDSIQSLTKDINKSGRRQDLVIASYVLGEIPSLKDRITLVRQLWDLTGDILVLVEPGTPQGSNIISQMRSHILWMEKRRSHKLQNAANKASKDLMTLKTGAFIVAPCPHDGPCPLQNTDKYCHFVQRLERTSSQRLYKRSKGPLRGFEDEKFCYVAFRRGTRPREPWPLDGMKFETLKQMHAKRIPEDLEIDVESQFGSEEAQNDEYEKDDGDTVSYDSDYSETDAAASENDNPEEEENDEDEEEEEVPRADLGSGWGRIVYMPLRRGKRVELDVCRATNSEGTEGSFDRVVITQSKNPTLHHQARRSLWGDLWPLRSEKFSKFYM
ncbi:Methyltransferase-like protein 17, mitochondrial [Sesamum alatum]|uniref:Methyltransferase-like protein 17, mitochondrial n=1 Tax=Sesamum alatum TaxID=300844 RepID=A0AAE1Y3I8_9LAMI|nr:Methyltransferase-like protein 17, mitochondrial [Sesamum alatum]